MTKIQTELLEVVEHNRESIEKVGYDQNEAKDLVTFEFYGVSIYDPFIDETGIHDVDPYNYYGEKYLEKMIEDYKKIK